MADCRIYVRASHIQNPHDFYVRPISFDMWLESFQKRIAEMEKIEEEATAPPGLGETVLVEHDEHGWVRGRVSNVHEGKCSIYTLDYGETVHGLRPDQLRHYKYSAQNDPLPTALHCRMRYCEPPRGNTWNFAASAAFLSYIRHNVFIMTVVKHTPSGQLEVELENEIGETVSDFMVSTEAASFANDLQGENRWDSINCSNVEPAPLPQYTYDALKVGVETDTRVISVGEDLFHVVRLERYMGFRLMSGSIGAEYGDCRLLRTEERGEGMRVVCRVRRCGSLHYYRGSIVRVDPANGGNAALTRLVDLGENHLLPVQALRRSKPYLLQEPIFSVSCRLNEQQQKDDGLRSLLRSGRCIALRAEKVPDREGEPYIVSIAKVFADSVMHF